MVGGEAAECGGSEGQAGGVRLCSDAEGVGVDGVRCVAGRACGWLTFAVAVVVWEVVAVLRVQLAWPCQDAVPPVVHDDGG